MDKQQSLVEYKHMTNATLPFIDNDLLKHYKENLRLSNANPIKTGGVLQWARSVACSTIDIRYCFYWPVTYTHIYPYEWH